MFELPHCLNFRVSFPADKKRQNYYARMNSILWFWWNDVMIFWGVIKMGFVSHMHQVDDDRVCSKVQARYGNVLHMLSYLISSWNGHNLVSASLPVKGTCCHVMFVNKQSHVARKNTVLVKSFAHLTCLNGIFFLASSSTRGNFT